MDKDSEARSHPTKRVPIEESGDTRVPRRRLMRHHRAASYATNEDKSLSGGERTGSSRTRKTMFEHLALDNSTNTYVPKMSERLGTMDLREILNQRRREAQQDCEPAPQIGPASQIALVELVPEQWVVDGDEHYRALKRKVDQLLAE
ncbi:hypothetical protein TorRG33x02_191440 [Trema orientale]|uniref:Uncharacterized protein n=1 Tax=Trema orientale TaxID=63057 RepID=A0A2P5EHR8_TREOI|nr:hypothetical protein TorRG33x02_191440 [Trema orientale]